MHNNNQPPIYIYICKISTSSSYWNTLTTIPHSTCNVKQINYHCQHVIEVTNGDISGKRIWFQVNTSWIKVFPKETASALWWQLKRPLALIFFSPNFWLFTDELWKNQLRKELQPEMQLDILQVNIISTPHKIAVQRYSNLA